MQRTVALLSRSGATRRVEGASNTTKGIVAAITVAFIGVAVYGGIYVPYFSEEADIGRERALQKGLREARLNPGPKPFTSSAQEDHAPGGLWKNVAVKRESASGPAASSGPADSKQ
jgi:hypothetical protein